MWLIIPYQYFNPSINFALQRRPTSSRAVLGLPFYLYASLSDKNPCPNNWAKTTCKPRR